MSLVDPLGTPKTQRELAAPCRADYDALNTGLDALAKQHGLKALLHAAWAVSPAPNTGEAVMARIDVEIFGGSTVYLLHSLKHAAPTWPALRLCDSVTITRCRIWDVVGGTTADRLRVR